jgi:L-ascorbate metabolism protein UlaG (beta-lactamase superfamily)
MKITKLGHCCLVIEEQGLKILTDPGDYTTAQNEISGLDVVLITHEHPDHFHVASLRAVLINNPAVRIFTNHKVGEILRAEGISYELLEDGQQVTVSGVTIEAHGSKHAFIYSTLPETVNVGYFINSKLFYPGDAFTDPGKPIEVLALPVAGPWLKISEVLEYAKQVKPRVSFPVHDGALKIYGAAHALPTKILTSVGIEFIIPEPGVAFNI